MGEFGVEALGDGHSAAEAEGAGGDFEAWGHLFAFVFGEVDESDDAVDGGLVEAAGDDVVDGLFLFDVAFDDGVEDVVGGEGVLVFLVGLEFGAGGFGDGVVGDGAIGGFAGFFPVLVDEVCEVVDHGFWDVGDDGKAAAHVAVEGAVADGDFRFVAGGEKHVTEFVGEGHEDAAAEACLDVFLGEAFGGVGEEGSEGGFHAFVGGFDGDGVELDAEALGEEGGVGLGVVRGEA